MVNQMKLLIFIMLVVCQLDLNLAGPVSREVADSAAAPVDDVDIALSAAAAKIRRQSLAEQRRRIYGKLMERLSKRFVTDW
ncbi:hypothetical protein BOX15_Mlig019765g1 [Macrostomum lignano]|uniref:Uncharacterized protein n=1 Tax=Macrostomum lignano TaxID=282301 RepID=A0A267GES3_9PLAT|nr:hypothetical protein BOX15_Mlig019765g1 [Macrostomum lignano]